MGDRAGRMLGYNAKLVPQPQDALAFGLLMPECGADQVIDEVDLGTGEISQSVGRPAIVTYAIHFPAHPPPKPQSPAKYIGPAHFG
jgi:hypothetical protein